jgi:hypothetical protein
MTPLDEQDKIGISSYRNKIKKICGYVLAHASQTKTPPVAGGVLRG